MAHSSQPPLLRRSFSLGASRRLEMDDSPPNEGSPLLPRQQRQGFLAISENVRGSSRTLESANLTSTRTPVRHQSRATSLRRFLTKTLGGDKAYGHGNGNAAQEPGYHHGLYDQFTSIDWMRDAISSSLNRAKIQKRRGLVRWLYDLQGWILAALVGVLTALVAYFIDVSEAFLFDVKFGYCSGDWGATRMQCCARATSCDKWVAWAERLSTQPHVQDRLNFVLYVSFMVLMTLLSCLLVLADKHVIRPSRPRARLELGPEVRAHGDSEERQVTLYPSAGSGVAEVKVICSGFIIHGFLGTKTLLIKSLGCVLSVASGLSIGKEGPYVHIAACIGNIMCRLFPSYDTNAGMRREIISASSAAGVAVAFGAPISGVLFSLEEVSYYFPAKTLFRTFFCSIIAAVSLKFLNPYLNGQIVPFEVKYNSDWHVFEMPMFVFLGVLGGAVGAFFVKAVRWSKQVRSLAFLRQRPAVEAIVVALVSGVTSYWNRYSTLPVAQLMYELASGCENVKETGTGLCPMAEEIPQLIMTLGVAFFIKTLLTIVCFGVKVPAGIYVPTMVVGGLLGRAFGHAVQYAIISSGSTVFGSCSISKDLEACIVPGVYALVTAGATMAGATRLSLTLALILFEITGSLDHVLPFSIAVLVAKWTADAMEPQSIYDLYMDMNDFPYLDNKRQSSLRGKLADITPPSVSGRTIDISSSPLVSAKDLINKLDFLVETGQFDGGLPILKDDVLIGIISCLDLAFCLDKIKGKPLDLCLILPRESRRERGDEFLEETDGTEFADFSTFIDPAPLALDINSSMELVYECFVKLGLRYICVLQNGSFVGLIHKKAFVKRARET